MATMGEDLLKQGFVQEGDSFILKPSPKQETGKVQQNQSNLPGVPTTTEPTPDSKFSLEQLRAKQSAIAGIGDTGTKLNELAALHGSVQGWVSTKIKNAQALAEQETGVAHLKAALDDSIRLDRNTPKYVAKYGLADSDETMQARQQYQAALAAANSLTQKYVTTDAELNAVNSEFDMFIKQQATLTGQEAATANKVKEFGDHVTKIAGMLNESPTPDLIMRNVAEYSQLAELSQSPVQLVDASITGKSAAPGIVLANMQAEKVAGTSDKSSPAFRQALDRSKAEVNFLRKVVNDTDSFEKLLASDPSIPNADKLAYKNLMALSATDDKIGEKVLQARKSIALKVLAGKARTNFLGNVDTWNVTNEQGTPASPFGDMNTPLGKAYAKAKSVSKEVSLQALVAGFSGLPLAEKAVARKQLEEAMQNAKDKASGGFYGEFAGTLSTSNEINTAIVKSFGASPDGSIGGIGGMLQKFNAATDWMGFPNEQR